MQNLTTVAVPWEEGTAICRRLSKPEAKFDYKDPSALHEIADYLVHFGPSYNLETKEKHELTLFNGGFNVAHTQLPADIQMESNNGDVIELSMEDSNKTLDAQSGLFLRNCILVKYVPNCPKGPMVMRVYEYRLRKSPVPGLEYCRALVIVDVNDEELRTVMEKLTAKADANYRYRKAKARRIALLLSEDVAPEAAAPLENEDNYFVDRCSKCFQPLQSKPQQHRPSGALTAPLSVFSNGSSCGMSLDSITTKIDEVFEIVKNLSNEVHILSGAAASNPNASQSPMGRTQGEASHLEYMHGIERGTAVNTGVNTNAIAEEVRSNHNTDSLSFGKTFASALSSTVVNADSDSDSVPMSISDRNTAKLENRAKSILSASDASNPPPSPTTALNEILQVFNFDTNSLRVSELSRQPFKLVLHLGAGPGIITSGTQTKKVDAKRDLHAKLLHEVRKVAENRNGITQLVNEICR